MSRECNEDHRALLDTFCVSEAGASLGDRVSEESDYRGLTGAPVDTTSLLPVIGIVLWTDLAVQSTIYRKPREVA